MQKLSSIFFVVLFLLWGNPVRSADVSRIAAVVNDQSITKADLNNRIKMAILSSNLEDTPQMREQMKSQILNVMIDEALQRQYAESFNIKCDDAQAEFVFKNIETRNNMPEGHLKKLLKKNKIPLEIMMNHIKSGIMWREYINGRYKSLVQVGEVDIDRALVEWEEAKAQPKFFLLEIFLSAPHGGDENAVNLRAWKLVKELRMGAKFSAMAQQFSQAASAAKGGMIGWVTPNQLDDTLPEILDKLEAGQISDPIRLQNGYHIFMVKDRKAPGESTGKQTLVSFVQALVPVSPFEGQDAVQRAIMKAQHLKNNAKSCTMMTRLVKKDGSIKMQHVPKVPLSNLPPQLQKLLKSLQINGSSKPILSQEGVFVFKKCEQEEFDPEDPSREGIKARLIQEKLSLLSQRELRNIRRSGYIDIRI